jgi:hypothetical protein
MVRVDATRFKSCFNFLRVNDGFSNKALFKAYIPLFEINNLSLLERSLSANFLLFSHFSTNLLTPNPEISMPNLLFAKLETCLYIYFCSQFLTD